MCAGGRSTAATVVRAGESRLGNWIRSATVDPARVPQGFLCSHDKACALAPVKPSGVVEVDDGREGSGAQAFPR